jgi:RHS repeat-associated protein
MPLSRSPNDLTTPERSGHWGAALLHAEIYLGSAPAVARFDEGFLSAGIRYFHNGHLSLRVTADSNGTKVGEQGHFPFGEDWYLSGAVAKYRFTGYERDSESGNDYALARYHINRLGRFSSPDRIAGSIGDPQTLNRYAYVRNDPVNLTDPSGQLAAAWETFFNWLLGIGCTWEDILEGRACSGDPAGGGGDPGSEPEVGGGGGASAGPPQSVHPQKPKPKCNREDPTNAKVLDFIQAHRADAQAIASQLNVPVQNILGLSAQESAYGLSAIAQGANNYFGLHAGAPGSTGTYTTSGGATVSAFPSATGYSSSGQAFATMYGSLVQDRANAAAFANSLVPKFNTANAKTGGNPDFLKAVTGAIAAIASRLNCP